MTLLRKLAPGSSLPKTPTAPAPLAAPPASPPPSAAEPSAGPDGFVAKSTSAGPAPRRVELDVPTAAGKALATGAGRNLGGLLGTSGTGGASAAPIPAALSGSPAFQGLSPEDRQRTGELHDALDAGGRLQLLAVLERPLDGKSALLSTDGAGATLLDHLVALSTRELAPELAREGLQRAELLESILQECASPGEINQSNRDTCTVTGMQYLLCSQQPAEYVRLMSGLLSPGGETALASGEPLVRVADSVAPDSATDRSASERLFQSAMMEYANGKARYSNVADLSESKVFGIGFSHSGLLGPQQKKGLEGLFGTTFETLSSDEAMAHLTRVSPSQTPVDLAWGGGGHAVVAERIEDGRVYFRNPWGPTTDAAGTAYTDPVRRLEDPATRLESMSLAEFKAALRTVYAAQD